ncbi:hypothetical protein ZIOFF_055819 [Zingiber officinale]|uniref:Uncharacterized protein n=1 Tax=Zingiber officinale TaxID=94328 RepID=A0A8J5KQ76_ZINOF|nr:hypothetical protein ZIOFF_055819 [Zingiber officinale]
MAAQNMTDVDAGLIISDDNSLVKKGVEVDSMSNQQPSITLRASHSKEKKKSSVDRVQKVSKRAKTLAVQNVDSDFKLLSAQVLEMLDKYCFVGSAHDGRVFRDVISRSSGLKIPQGGYYLVDARYYNSNGFLAPYRGHSHDPRECIPDEDEQSEDDDSDRGTETEQSGCTWNDVEKKIACEETWYLEWIKVRVLVIIFSIISFPYFSELEMVYGKDRATGLVAEDPMMTTQNITNVDAGLTISDDNSLVEKGVEVDSMPNQQHSGTSRASHSKEKKKSSVDRVQKISKRAKTSTVQNVNSDFKLLSAQVEGFMQIISSHFESMSSWVQGKFSNMPQVIEMLDKYGFVGKNKYKTVK